MLTAAWLFLKAIPPKVWLALAVLALLAAFGGWCYHKGAQSEKAVTEAVKKELAQFKADTKSKGDEQNRQAKLKDDQNKANQEKTDAEHKAAVDALNTRLAELRKSNTGRSQLPPAPATSSRPDLLCVDRTQYQREDGEITERLFKGARGLADEGSESTLGLDAGKAWAGRLTQAIPPRKIMQ